MKTTAGFVLALLAIIAMVVATGQLAADRVRASANVRHTLGVLQQIHSVRSTLQDAETGQRGYLLILEADYLDPFLFAAGRVNAEVASLRGLVVDNGPEVARVDRLEDTVRVKMVELSETVSAAQSGRLPEAMAR